MSILPSESRRGLLRQKLVCRGLVLAACLLSAAAQAGQPRGDWLDTTPVRGWDHSLVLRRSGFSYSCNECHRDFTSSPVVKDSPGEHRAIVLAHGEDMTCLSCHYEQDRTLFRDFAGAPVTPDQSIKLCATCHGTVLRDWRAGVHGRSNGYWDAALGPVVRLDCIQCHDPHRPAFESMAPLPPPLLSGPADHATGDAP